MISQIAKALEKGFTEDQILDFVIKKFPKFASKITGAKSSGFNASQILNTLLGNRQERENASQPLTEFEEMRNQDIQGQQSRNQKAKTAAVLAGTSLAAPIAASALQRAIPSSLQTLLPTLTANTTGQDQSAIATQESQQPPVNIVEQNIPQVAETVQPEQKTNIVDVLWNDLEKSSGKKFGFESDAFLKIARRMKSTGEIKSKEDFQKLFQLFEQKKNEGKDLPSALRESSSEFDEEKLSSNKEQDKIETPKIEKKSIVSSPEGVGFVKEIRNGQAIVDIDGKMHKVKEDELESSPIPEKDLAVLYDELIGSIEKETGEDVSRMVQWAGYNPETNTLQFLPHTGALYTYDDISDEDAALLRDILSTRKSSGENFIGAWKAGSKSPIGAALSKLIRKLQSERGGKGNEYLAKHEPIYSAYEPAIQAKKRKKKK